MPKTKKPPTEKTPTAKTLSVLAAAKFHEAQTAKTPAEKALALAEFYRLARKAFPAPVIHAPDPYGKIAPADLARRLSTILGDILDVSVLDPQDRNQAGCHLARKATDEAHALAAKYRKPGKDIEPHLIWQDTEAARHTRLAYSTILILCNWAGAGTPLTDDQRKRLAVIRDGLAQCAAPARKGAVRPRRRQPDRKPRELTARQIEVVQLYGELKGNIGAVAKQLARNPSTIRECLGAAYGKMGQAGWRNRDTRRGKMGRYAAGKLPTDKDGQEAVAGQDDGPASTRLAGGVLRDARPK